MSDIDLSRSADYRNVTDFFKGQSDDEIKATLDERRGDMITMPYVTAMRLVCAKSFS